jgi:hypothetical protein
MSVKVKQFVKQTRKRGSNSGVEYRLLASKTGAGDEARTRDPLLGKQMLYH